MPTVLLICELKLGMGHLVRTTRLAEAMVRHFRVVLLVFTEIPVSLDAPEGVDLRVLPAAEEVGSVLKSWPVQSGLLDLAKTIMPDVVMIEYFPFGRSKSWNIYVPFIMQLHRVPSQPLLFCSLRDIQDSLETPDHGMHITRLLNRWFDGVLVHADEHVSPLEQSFDYARAITVPVTYTNYVGRAPLAQPMPRQRERTIVVSSGGGRAGGRLTWCALEAGKRGLLAGYTLRVFAGNLLADAEWESLQATYADVESVDLQRWTKDLRAELVVAEASVSQFGYNTALELLSTGVPALVVPYTSEQEPEQMHRALLMAQQGALRVLPQEQLSPETLAAEIHETLQFKPRRVNLKMDGAERTSTLLLERLAQRTLKPASPHAL